MDLLVVSSKEKLDEIVHHSFDKLNVELEIDHIFDSSCKDFSFSKEYDLVIIHDTDFSSFELDVKALIFSKILQKSYPTIVFLEDSSRVDVFCGLNLKDYFYEPIDYQRVLLRLQAFQQSPTMMNNELLSKFVVKQKNEVVFIDYSKIIFFEKDAKKLYVHLADKTLVVQESLKGLMDRLPSCFVRVHNSYVVNVTFISKIVEVGNRSYEIFFERLSKKALMSRYRSKALLKDYYRIG